jgi:hypothetical protein
LGDLEREKREGFQQQTLYACHTYAKDQRREQELDHGGSKAFGRVISLIFHFCAFIFRFGLGRSMFASTISI